MISRSLVLGTFQKNFSQYIQLIHIPIPYSIGLAYKVECNGYDYGFHFQNPVASIVGLSFIYPFARRVTRFIES